MSSLQGYVDRCVRFYLVAADPLTLAIQVAFYSCYRTAVPSWYASPLLYLLISTHLQGVLAGFDQKSNVVLSDSKERVYSIDDGVEEIPLGLYLVKGDMMCVSPP